MKHFSTFGLNEFVICLGYKGDLIKDFFENYELRTQDFEVNLSDNSRKIFRNSKFAEEWKVVLADTGLNTMTGGRIKRIQKFVSDDLFICTYGDGLSNVNLEELISFHKSHGKIATVTAVQPSTRFGSLKINDLSLVEDFAEKPKATAWVNGGFFVFGKEIFNYLDDECVLEDVPLHRLVNDNQLMAYKHHGFWQPMDTFREAQELNELWEKKAAPWKTW